MNWLNAIPEADRRAIVAELAQKLSAEPLMVAGWEKAVERVLERHGFKQPHSATSVAHNIMAENTERDHHAARMLALSNLIAQARQVTNWLGICGAPAEGARHRNSLDLAIAAVEREFKP